MNQSTIAVAVLALTLAGCSSGQKASDKSATGGDANQAAAAAISQIKLQPGEYEATTKVLEFSVAGMPAAQADIMQKAMGAAAEKPIRYCLTAAEAAQGPQEMVKNMQEGGCKMLAFNSASNGLSGKVQCEFPGGGSANSTFDGTYTSDGSSMDTVSDVTLNGGQSIHRKSHVDTHRVGECSG